MTTATLVAGFALNTLAAVVFAVVGLRFSRSPVAQEARLAGHMFVLWWWGFAGYMFLWIALPMGLVAVGVTDVTLYLGLLYGAMFSLCLGIGCLVFYILYLLTGSRRSLAPVLVYYTALFVMSVVLFTVRGPVEVAIHDWWVDFVYETPLSTIFHVFVVLLILPTTILALAYLLLLGRTSDRLMKIRIIVLSGSIIVWGLGGMAARLYEADEWQFIARTIVGLAAAFMILAAYEAPAFLRRRIEASRGEREGHLQRMRERHEAQRERRREREGELRWRMEELI